MTVDRLYTGFMIRVSNTEDLTGVTISGDFYDLEQLTDALHDITVSDMEELDKRSEPYVNISMRVLGLCYDIRHASQVLNPALFPSPFPLLFLRETA